MSCKMPNLNTAVKPMRDQRKGITNKTFFIFPSNKSNMPNVKIVVGQGTPNVGVLG